MIRTRTLNFSFGLILVLGSEVALLSSCTAARPVAQNSPAQPPPHPGAALYAEHCASCHGPGRMGLTGPALFPENLERLKKTDALAVVTRGRPSTQMLGFQEKLKEGEIQSVVDYIYSPVSPLPDWSFADIQKSVSLFEPEKPLQNKPTFKADPLNLFFVVELADNAITVLDGDRFKALTRFKTRFAVHGGVKYSPDGRYAYMISRDGWVSKFDIYNLRMTGEVRAGLNSRNVAVSGDGKYLAVANTLPKTLVLLDAGTLEPLVVHAGLDQGEVPTRFSAVYTAHPRRSFIVALKDVPELWEVLYFEGARPPYTGLVHDYKAESGEDISTAAKPFPIRRIRIENPLDDFYFDAKYENLFGTGRGTKAALVVNLLVGRTIAQVPIQGMPHLASGISFDYKGMRVMASPNLAANVISFIDTKNWKIIGEVQTPAAGFFLRSHEKSKYAFADVFFGKEKDSILVINKETLKISRVLKPSRGKTAAHSEFTRDGRHVLISIWEDDGALVVYDTKTLKEVRRIPMRKPSGKYNVFNKISLSEGTSH